MADEHKDVGRRYFRGKLGSSWHVADEDGKPLCATKASAGTFKTELSFVDRASVCRRCQHRVNATPHVPRPSITMAAPHAVYLTKPRKTSADLATTEQQMYLARYGYATPMMAAGMTVSEASALIDSRPGGG
ncbi:MAG: hypothetical protein ABIY70_08785 [Capsulimonas sp.]|uniref:hypothetical protein n=1 Tax=Capsulimonas sp. TaxID=2494211 RepID=UPI0032676058